LLIQDIKYTRFVTAYTIAGLFGIAVQSAIIVQFNIPIKIALFDALVTNILIIAAGISTYNILRFYKPARENILYPRVWSLLLVIIITVLFRNIMLNLFKDNEAYLVFVEKSMPIRAVFNVLNVVLLSVFTVLWFFFNDQQRKRQQTLDAEALTKEAELVSLRQQLQPHFLFNSLNSISALVGTRPEEARKMIHQLSEFLRGTLRNNEHETFTLADELKHLQLYLDIEKVRFGHRLSPLLHADQEALLCKMPPLILQPLVENAIKFGLYDIIGDVEINIVCKMTDGGLNITITNPFDEKTASHKKGAGFGLTSVKRRLYLLFARNDLLITSNKQDLFITSVSIPQPL
jgi:two-component system, LytTR family, sensor kinase